MPRGSQTNDDIRQEITALYARGVTRTPDILAALEGATRFAGRIPSERTVARITREIREGYTPEQEALDVPWQLGPVQSDGLLPHGLPPSAVPVLLECHRMMTMEFGRQAFTLRLARWVSALQFAVKPDETTLLLNMAFLHANRERWAAVESKPLDTADLDAAWSFAPWRSEAAMNVYLAAVEAGIIPVLDPYVMPSLTLPTATTPDAVTGEFLASLKMQQHFAESLPEHRRDEFYQLANRIVRRPETWAFVQASDGSAQWSNPLMLQELEDLAAGLRGDD